MTEVIAHRGASRDCPENTLAAFDEALAQGADAIELDVQLSGDGHPMVYHDRTLVRAGGGRRRLNALTRRELRRLDPGPRVAPRFRGAPMPTLAEVLRRYGSRTKLYLELKARGSTPHDRARHRQLALATCDAVIGARLERRVTLLCFVPQVLEVCRSFAPRIPKALNLSPPRLPGRELLAQLEWLDALSVDIRTLTPAFARAIRATGRPMVTFTCNTRERVERALRAGVSGVMADRPGWLASVLRDRGAA